MLLANFLTCSDYIYKMPQMCIFLSEALNKYFKFLFHARWTLHTHKLKLGLRKIETIKLLFSDTIRTADNSFALILKN